MTLPVKHEVQTKDGAILDVLEDGSGHRVIVNRLGAEMVSIQTRDSKDQWVGFLYRDGDMRPPASGWANHATVMGYFLHRLVNEQSQYRDSVVHGGNHGFLRHFGFEKPELRDGALIYSVRPDQIPPSAYPLRVGLELSYAFVEGWLRVGFRFQNFEESLTAHVSFGLHPGFEVSSPSSCAVNFPPGHYIRHFAPGNFLDGRTEVIDFAGGDMPFARAGLPDSYLIGLQDVPTPIFSIEDSGRRIEADFSGVPYMTLWSDGGDFFCLEPCWGLPDSRPQKPFEEKTGIQCLAPGGLLEASCRFRFTIIP